MQGARQCIAASADPGDKSGHPAQSGSEVGQSANVSKVSEFREEGFLTMRLKLCIFQVKPITIDQTNIDAPPMHEVIVTCTLVFGVPARGRRPGRREAQGG